MCLILEKEYGVPVIIGSWKKVKEVAKFNGGTEKYFVQRGPEV